MPLLALMQASCGFLQFVADVVRHALCRGECIGDAGVSVWSCFRRWFVAGARELWRGEFWGKFPRDRTVVWCLVVFMLPSFILDEGRQFFVGEGTCGGRPRGRRLCGQKDCLTRLFLWPLHRCLLLQPPPPAPQGRRWGPQKIARFSGAGRPPPPPIRERGDQQVYWQFAMITFSAETSHNRLLQTERERTHKNFRATYRQVTLSRFF